MASENRRRRSHSQLAADISKVEAPPPISVAAPAPLSEGPAPTGSSEPGPSEVGLSGINYYTYI